MDPITNYLGYAILVTVGFIAGWAVSEIRFAITANKMIKAIDNEVKPEKGSRATQETGGYRKGSQAAQEASV